MNGKNIKLRGQTIIEEWGGERMLSLYAMGLLIAGGISGLLIVAACGPQSVKDKFNSLLWNPEEDEV